MNTISRVATLMAMLVLSTPKTTNPITTSSAATRTAQCEPIHFESQDASEANFFEICRLIWRVEHRSDHQAFPTNGVRPPVLLADPVPRLERRGTCGPQGTDQRRMESRSLMYVVCVDRDAKSVTGGEAG